MIKFSGELSKKSKNQLFKDYIKVCVISTLIACIIVGALALMIAKEVEFMLLFWIMLIPILITFIMACVIPFAFKEKYLKNLYMKILR